MKNFDSVEEAFDWMENEALLGENCIDNHRFSFLSNDKEMNKYEMQKDSGCCGSFDEEITICNMPAIIGCNYGH